MIDIRNSIRAIVKIQTPSFFDAEENQTIPENTWNFDSASGDIGADVLSLSVTKAMNSPFGRFSLNLSPRLIARNKHWGDLIPPYSLVEIWLQSYPRDKTPVLAMVGLVDEVSVDETYTNAVQNRSIQITGKESTCLFVDQKTYTVPSTLDTVEPADDIKLPELYSQKTMLLQGFNINPDLVQENTKPYDSFYTFFKIITEGGVRSEGNQEAQPFVNLDLPFNPSTRDKLSIADLIFYDPEKTKNNMADPRFIFPASSFTIQNNIPIWTLMSSLVSPVFFELYTVSKELDGRGVNEIIFRKKPYAGRLNENGQVIEDRPVGQSQLDEGLPTFELGDLDVLSRSLQRSPQNIKNFYRVLGAFLNQNIPSDPWLYSTPLIDYADNSPSSIKRYGLRLFDVDDYYLAQDSDEIEVKKQRQKLLWYWHRFEPVFKSGDYVIRGNPSIDIGTRITHNNYEYYVTGVSHNFTATSQSPAFLTKLTVERGWPIA